MKSFLLAGLLALAPLVATATPAQADDGHGRRGRFDNRFDHRDWQRRQFHREAHRYPMTRWQHRQLHDALRYDRHRDRVWYRDFDRGHWRHHRPSGVWISPGGFGYHGSNISFWFGR